jgi:DNA-binding beta-propeller fold protein YncE
MRVLIAIALVGILMFPSLAVAETLIGGLPSFDNDNDGRAPCGTLATCPAPDPGWGLPGGVAWDGSHIWVGTYFGSATLYQIDPVSCSVVHTIPSPSPEGVGGLAWDGSHLWCCPEQTGQIYELDPADGSVISVIPAPSFGEPDPNAAGLAWDGQYLWHADYGHGMLYKLDPSDGSIVTSYPAPGLGPSGVGYGGGVVVLMDYSTDQLHEIDPSDGSVINSCDTPDSHPWGAAVAGSVWNAGSNTQTLYLLDVVVTPVESLSWGTVKALYR